MIQLEDVCIRAGGFSLEKVSMEVPSGKYAVLMGKTGRGKTSLLECICGLRSIESGRISVRGVDVTRWTPADREIGYVPQDLALFPTLTVAAHLKFALQLRKQSSSQMQSRADELGEVLGISHLMDRQVAKLSGGESQRVALGRALSFRPAVLLLDEPLSALDEDTRQEMHVLLRKVQTSTGVTTLHVTHNEEEAEALADMRFEICEGQLLKL